MNKRFPAAIAAVALLAKSLSAKKPVPTAAELTAAEAEAEAA